MKVNLTIVEEDLKDPFEKLFEDPYLDVFFIGLYLSGLVSCVGLVLVSWFEKSGQAGSYRSLANQLVSMRLDQLVMFYTFGTNAVLLRRLLGPLPMIYCKISSFFQYLAIFNSCHFTILIVGTKFCFIYIFKSIPVMDDKLLSTFIMLTVNFWSLLATIGKMYIDEKVTIQEHVCSGTWNYNRDHDFNAPIVFIVMAYTLVLYMIFSVAIMVKKKKISTLQPSGNYNNGQSTDLSNLVSTSLSTLLLGVCVLSLSILNKSGKTPETLSKYPLIALMQFSGVPCLFGIVTVQAIHHFWVNKSIRKAAWRLFFREQIVANVP